MGQQEVLEILNKNKGKHFSTNELSRLINVNPKSINKCCKNLIKTNMLKTILIKKRESERFYWVGKSL